MTNTPTSVTVRADSRTEPQALGTFGAGLASALLFGALLTVPVFGLLGLPTGLPLMTQRLRGGLSGAVIATGLAAGLVGAVFSLGLASLFLFVFALPALLLADGLARGRGLRSGCAWAFALLALEIGSLLLFAGPRLQSEALHPFEWMRSPAFVDDMRKSGLPPERVDLFVEQVKTSAAVVQVVYPAVYVIAGALLVLIDATLLRLYLVRRDPGWLEGGEFENVRWPFGLSVLFVLSGASVVVPPLRPAGYNVLLVVAFFYAIQGLAVVAFYAYRLAGPPLLRVALMFLVLANPWAPQILALLGLFDTWLDFRKWARPAGA
jgi:uncharacterized protein YybS (DUF2232 family)